MGSDDILDILLLIFVIAVLTPIMIVNAIPMFRGDIGGFNTLIEKTAHETSGEIKPVERSFKREDVLLMAVIADRKAPKPAKFQSAVGVQSPDISIDNLVKQRISMFNILKSCIVYTGQLEIQTYVGSADIVKWVVTHK